MAISNFVSRSLVVATFLVSSFVLPQAAYAAVDLVAQTASKLESRFASGSRYVIGSETAADPHPFCTEIAAADPVLDNEVVKPYARLAGHSAAKLLECDYKLRGSARHGWVIVVAATPRNLAKRIVNACAEAASDAIETCVGKLIDSSDGESPAGSNSFIFPITGFISEPCKGGTNLIGFRHGVTIQYTDGPSSKNKLAYCVKTDETVAWQRNVGLTFGTFDVFNVGRVAALSRIDLSYDAIFPPPDEGTLDGLAADKFQQHVRDNEIEAVESGHDRLMIIKAALKMARAVPAKRSDGKPGDYLTTLQLIPDLIWDYMQGKSVRIGLKCPDRKDLAFLTVHYVGFDGKMKVGQMVVAEDLAEDVAKAMDTIQKSPTFRIERLELVDRFGGSDDESMAANNTSAFNCRLVTGGSRLSAHGEGQAIDINPVQNPYVKKTLILPPAGKSFDEPSERKPTVMGIILKGGDVYKAFVNPKKDGGIEWAWGGDWTDKKDYQHFSKNGK
jgi:poly-gamma-glutamate synthesis protein (capsule biosynthesis protein)